MSGAPRPGDGPPPGAGGGLLPAERKVRDELGALPLDFRAMWAISNLFRSSTAIRRHMEARVLGPYRMSWTSFVGLWVLWVWGEMEARGFAAAVGISRPTATGVMTTLESRGYVTRRKDPRDGRMVIVELTPKGRELFERSVGAQATKETFVASALNETERKQLNKLLRRMVLRAEQATSAPAKIS